MALNIPKDDKAETEKFFWSNLFSKREHSQVQKNYASGCVSHLIGWNSLLTLSEAEVWDRTWRKDDAAAEIEFFCHFLTQKPILGKKKIEPISASDRRMPILRLREVRERERAQVCFKKRVRVCSWERERERETEKEQETEITQLDGIWQFGEKRKEEARVWLVSRPKIVHVGSVSFRVEPNQVKIHPSVTL